MNFVFELRQIFRESPTGLRQSMAVLARRGADNSVVAGMTIDNLPLYGHQVHHPLPAKPGQ